MHLREDAEAIPFYRSEAQERARIESDFDEVFRNFARLFRKQRAPNLLQRGFSHLSLALPAVIRADVALSGELKVGCPVQAAGALTAILWTVGVSPTSSRARVGSWPASSACI